MRIVEPSVELEWITPDAAVRIEHAGRTCYKSEDKATGSVITAERFLAMLVGRGHESVLEHGVASFKFVCDRGVSHEIVRHRIASFSQESTRYCNYGNDKFGGISLSPMMTGLTEEQVSRRNDLWCRIEDVYLAEIKEGVSPQQARDNLPTCLKTELVMTANFREWRHFIKLRTSPAAHPQIRVLAEKVRKILFSYSPTLFGPVDHGEVTFSAEEKAAFLEYIRLSGKDCELNGAQLGAFASACKKIGA